LTIYLFTELCLYFTDVYLLDKSVTAPPAQPDSQPCQESHLRERGETAKFLTPLQTQRTGNILKVEWGVISVILCKARCL